MATLTPQKVAASGLNLALAAADVAGDQFLGAGRKVLVMLNGDAAPKTVTITSQVSNPRPGTIAQNQAVTVPAGERRYIGPFENGFVDTNGYVQVTYDAVTSVTVGVLDAS